MDLIQVALTAILSVVALFVITKTMGHKQVAQLDFFDYVSGITIGSIGAELATELEEPHKPLIALGLYGVVSLLLNFLAHKMPKTRKYINGSPTILMYGGKIFRLNLKAAKLDLSEFMLLCREEGYFDLDEIDTAVFEHNGRLSILPKAKNRPITASDLGIAVKKSSIATEVIMDGCVLEENLKRMGRDKTWLTHRLNDEGCGNEKEIFLALFHPDEDKLSIYKNEDVE